MRKLVRNEGDCRAKIPNEKYIKWDNTNISKKLAEKFLNDMGWDQWYCPGTENKKTKLTVAFTKKTDKIDGFINFWSPFVLELRRPSVIVFLHELAHVHCFLQCNVFTHLKPFPRMLEILLNFWEDWIKIQEDEKRR